MHEFHCGKEHVIARTFHKTFRLVKKYLLLGLLVAIALKAQQSSPSAQAWAGVVRTAAGEPVAGAKVTVFTPGAKKNLTAVTGYRNRRKVRDCGASIRAKSRERANARTRSDRASGSEYY